MATGRRGVRRLFTSNFSSAHKGLPVQLIVEQPQGLAKVYRRGGRTFMYIAKVTLNHGTVTITPRQHIPPEELEWLKHACTQGEADEPCEPDKWKLGPDGWVTHVSAVIAYREVLVPRCDAHRLRIRRLLCPAHQRLTPGDRESA